MMLKFMEKINKVFRIQVYPSILLEPNWDLNLEKPYKPRLVTTYLILYWIEMLGVQQFTYLLGMTY